MKKLTEQQFRIGRDLRMQSRPFKYISQQLGIGVTTAWKLFSDNPSLELVNEQISLSGRSKQRSCLKCDRVFISNNDLRLCNKCRTENRKEDI